MIDQLFKNTYVIVVLCMLIIDVFLVKRLMHTQGFGEKQKWIQVMLVACEICIISDALCVIFSQTHQRFLKFYLNGSFDFSFAFVGYYLFEYMESMYYQTVERNKISKMIAKLPIILAFILIVFSYWTGSVFLVDQAGNYFRGPLYNFFFLVLANGYTEISILLILFRMYKQKDQEKLKNLKYSLMYVAPILIGTYIQVFFTSFPGSSIGLTVTMIFIFTNNLQELLMENKKELELRNHQLESALEKAKLNNEIIGAISKIYWMIYKMDLETGMYEEVSAGSEMHQLTGEKGIIKENFEEARKVNITPEYQERMKEFLDMTTLSKRIGKNESIATEYCATNGQWYLARFIVKKRNEQGEVIQVLYAVRMITGQKIKELEYQKEIISTAEDAKKANMAKTDFLRRMSHDIRTPINGIMGILNIAEHYPEDMEKQKEYRHKLKEAAKFLQDLVNDILDMNKLESGNVVLEHRSFDFFELLDELRTITQMNAQEYSVEVIVKQWEVSHRYLKGSPLHLRQVIQNIASNAVKYNVAGGKIFLSCKEIAVQDDHVTYELTCEDTGRGMSKEFQKKAFDTFSQEISGARTSFTGTGLGLAITKQLVDLMGAHLTMESEVGKGTKFVLTITLEMDHSYQKEEEKIGDLNVSGLHVLLVEDNELNMEIAQFLLKNQGLEVTLAWNGQEAVELFSKSKEGSFDFILMDVMMPIMDGLTATKKIRSLPRKDAQTVPIFAMTANAFHDDIVQSKKAGMNEHLTKPLQEGKLMDMIKKYKEGNH